MCDRSSVFSGCSGNRGRLFFPFSGTHLKLFRREWPICLLGDFCRWKLHHWKLNDTRFKCFRVYKQRKKRTKLLYSLVSWSLLCGPETLPRQKQSWHSWYEWHFWHLYRNPVKFSLWHASHIIGCATENTKNDVRSHSPINSPADLLQLPVSTAAILWYNGNQIKQCGPGSDMSVSRKSFTVTLEFCRIQDIIHLV